MAAPRVEGSPGALELVTVERAPNAETGITPRDEPDNHGYTATTKGENEGRDIATTEPAARPKWVREPHVSIKW